MLILARLFALKGALAFQFMDVGNISFVFCSVFAYFYHIISVSSLQLHVGAADFLSLRSLQSLSS